MDEQIATEQQADNVLLSTQRAPAKEGQGAAAAYDFGQAVKLTSDQKYRIDEQTKRLCSVLSRTLGVYLNTEVNLVLQSATQATYKEYIANLSSPVIATTFEISPYTPPATWQIDAPVAYAIIDCMIGGSGRQVGVPDREATPLEAVVIGQFCDEILNTWSTTWEGIKSSSLQVLEVVTSAGRLENINSAQEQNYTGVIESSVAGVEGLMHTSMPASALQSLLQRRKRQTVDKDMKPMVMQSVRQAAMPIEVTLGRHRRSVSELAQLQEGSVIDLEHHVDDPCVVSIAGRPKFLARSGVRRGRLAVKLTASITS